MKQSVRKKIEIYINLKPHSFFDKEADERRIHRAFQKPNSFEIWLEEEEKEKPDWLKKYIENNQSITDLDIIAKILQKNAKNPLATYIIFEVLSGRSILEISRKLNLSRVSIYKTVSKKQILQTKKVREKMLFWEIKNLKKDPNWTQESIRRYLKISPYKLRKYLSSSKK